MWRDTWIREIKIKINFQQSLARDAAMSLEYVLPVLLILAVSLLLKFVGSRRRLAPGPWGIPVLGFLPWVNPDAPHETFAALVRKHGPVCGLKLGSLYTVLLGDAHLVRQALAKDELSGRAPLYVTHGIMRGYGESVLPFLRRGEDGRNSAPPKKREVRAIANHSVR